MSDAAFESTVARVAREGPRRYAEWDGEVFAELARGPALTLWRSLESSSAALPTLDAYLTLLAEAVGQRYVGRRAPDNLIASLWTGVLPVRLAAHPAGSRVELLAKLWNLGEGLLGEAAWVNRYVAAASSSLADLSDIEGFLVRVLEPALVPCEPAAFEGPFVVTVLDTRPLDDAFLPGEMHLAAPAVLCVHDRRRPGSHVGVLLKKEQRSSFLGGVPCLGHAPGEDPLPALRIGAKGVRIGARNVELPFLREAQATLVARSGYAVASAVDSQRLWIVESP